MATITEVKTAVVQLLGDTLPADVRVLYADPPDVRGRAVILGSSATSYEPSRMRAASTLLRYDLVYNLELLCCSGPNLRSPQVAEEAAYGLLDLVLTPLVRGDATGRTRLADTLPSVTEVRPVSDERHKAWDADDSHEVVVSLNISVATRRD